MSHTDLKRTLETDDVDSSSQTKKACVRPESVSAYCVQRQTVLQLSLQKLCRVPSLGRRVLITNTLRRIQNEISHPGVSRLSAEETRESQEPPASQMSDQAPTQAPDRERELLFSLHSSLEIEAGIEDLPAEPSDTTFSWTSPFHKSNRNMETSEKDVQTVSPEPQVESDLSHLAHSPTHSFLNPSPPPLFPVFLPDLSLDDFLFSEIDNFLCELNPCSSSFEPSSSSKVVSMVTDDLVRSLTTQPFRTDLNELDHIMELLVSS